MSFALPWVNEEDRKKYLEGNFAVVEAVGDQDLQIELNKSDSLGWNIFTVLAQDKTRPIRYTIVLKKKDKL